MWIRTVAALALVCACKGHAEHDATHVATADPWAAAPAAAETPQARKQRADAALARVAQIMPRLAKVRELSFDRDIPRAYQSIEEFRAFERAQIAKELPADNAEDASAALFHIGLLPKPGNLAALEEQAFASQAGAYYESGAKKFFLVMVPASDLMLDTLSAHELTHGLQDQHFDLTKFLPSGNALDADELVARRCLVEGDATFTMFLFALDTMGGDAKPNMAKMLRAQLDQFATMSPEDLLRQNVLGLTAKLDPELKTSLDQLDEMPSTVLVPIVDEYFRGAQLIAATHERGGWKAVDALYADPPESTEQVLHPSTKLFPHRDHPHRVAIAKPTDGTEVASLVFGELQWQIYFQLWLPAQKAIASEGWGGDRVSVVKRGDGTLVARIATVWDTQQDADELHTAYVASLAKRFPKGAGDPTSPAGFDRGDGRGKIYVHQDGLKVFIVDGGLDHTAVDQLVATARID